MRWQVITDQPWKTAHTPWDEPAEIDLAWHEEAQQVRPRRWFRALRLILHTWQAQSSLADRSTPMDWRRPLTDAQPMAFQPEEGSYDA